VLSALAWRMEWVYMNWGSSLWRVLTSHSGENNIIAFTGSVLILLGWASYTPHSHINTAATNQVLWLSLPLTGICKTNAPAYSVPFLYNPNFQHKFHSSNHCNWTNFFCATYTKMTFWDKHTSTFSAVTMHNSEQGHRHFRELIMNTWCYNREYCTVHSHECENLISNNTLFMPQM
jgi:hypothetical protein